jgi:uncharacterized membrane protein
MNWKLILQLSAFGLVMAFATVSMVPQNDEPFCWLIIFILCAYIIAKNAPSKYFLHGFLVSMVNCVWIVCVHMIMYKEYIANHPQMASMNTTMSAHPRLAMLVIGPFFGAVSGLVLGLFAWIASRLLAPKVAAH